MTEFLTEAFRYALALNVITRRRLMAQLQDAQRGQEHQRASDLLKDLVYVVKQERRLSSLMMVLEGGIAARDTVDLETWSGPHVVRGEKLERALLYRGGSPQSVRADVDVFVVGRELAQRLRKEHQPFVRGRRALTAPPKPSGLDLLTWVGDMDAYSEGPQGLLLQVHVFASIDVGDGGRQPGSPAPVRRLYLADEVTTLAAQPPSPDAAGHSGIVHKH